MSAVDPANVRAQARAELCLSRELAQPWHVESHPRQGGSSGYPVWSQEEHLEKWNAGEETVASQVSLYPWPGRIGPHHRTGNSARTQIVGTDMINLVVLLLAHPDATCDEIAAHLYNEGGEIFSNQTISKLLKELDITQKIASVEAYQAQAEVVQRHVYAFWNHPPPLGICGIPRRMLIDVDEFGVTLERCNVAVLGIVRINVVQVGLVVGGRAVAAS